MQGSIVCGQCGTSNPSSRKTCDNCGAMLTGVHLSPADTLPHWLSEPEQAAVHPAPGSPQPDVSTPEVESKAVATELELPAWLRADSTSEGDVHAGLTSAPDLPDWLGDVEELPASTEGGTTGADTSISSGVPSWLLMEADDSAPSAQADVSADTGASRGGDTSSEPAWPYGDQIEATSASMPLHPAWLNTPDTSIPPEDVPPWQSATAASSSAGEQAFDAGPISTLPGWLTDETAQENQPAQSAAEPEPAPLYRQTGQAEVEFPDWLRPADEEQGDALAYPEGGLPDWPSTQTSAADWEQPSSATGDAVSTKSGAAGEIPGWLIDDTAHDAQQTNQDDHVARIYSTEQAGAGTEPAPQIPAWLNDIEPLTVNPSPEPPAWLNEPDRAALGPAAPDGGGAPIARLEMPEWLLRDAESSAAATATVEAPPVWLHGLGSSAEAARPSMPVAETAVAAPAIERSPERLAAMQLLERLLVEPVTEPAAVPVPRPRRRVRVGTLLQVLAFLILLLAILAALLGPRIPFSVGAAVPSSSAAALATRIAALPQSAPVLLAYEWDARRGAEMEALEAAVVAKLTARHLPLLLMTTDPQGALLDERRATLLREGTDRFYNQAGLGFVDLGYKPGGALALARLASNFGSVFEQDWTGRNLTGERNVIQTMCQSPNGAISGCSLDHVGMVIVMADESEDARIWMEQVASAHPSLPITFVTPVELAPLIQPYLTRPDVTMITGLRDAIGLQEFGGSADERLARRVDAGSAGGTVFGLLVLIGMVPAVWSGRRARRRGKAGVWER